jgi:hypothetical protein
LLSVSREAGMIVPAPLPPITPDDQIFEGFSDYLRQEHGLAPRSIISHLPVVRRFPREVCSAGTGDLGNITQEGVNRYIRAPRPGLQRGIRKADVLVAPHISPIPPS